MSNNKPAITDIIEENTEINSALTELFSSVDSLSEENLLDNFTQLFTNMLNFFAKEISDIPAFDSLNEEQKKILRKKLGIIINDVKQKRINNSKELSHSFVFTVFAIIGEKGKKLEAEEILFSKKMDSLNKFLMQYSEREVTSMQSTNNIPNNDFINDALLQGVPEALKNIGLSLDSSVANKSAVNILESAHKKLAIGKTK